MSGDGSSFSSSYPFETFFQVKLLELHKGMLENLKKIPRKRDETAWTIPFKGSLINYLWFGYLAPPIGKDVGQNIYVRLHGAIGQTRVKSTAFQSWKFLILRERKKPVASVLRTTLIFLTNSPNRMCLIAEILVAHVLNQRRTLEVAVAKHRFRIFRKKRVQPSHQTWIVSKSNIGIWAADRTQKNTQRGANKSWCPNAFISVKEERGKKQNAVAPMR